MQLQPGEHGEMGFRWPIWHHLITPASREADDTEREKLRRDREMARRRVFEAQSTALDALAQSVIDDLRSVPKRGK